MGCTITQVLDLDFPGVKFPPNTQTFDLRDNVFNLVPLRDLAALIESSINTPYWRFRNTLKENPNGLNFIQEQFKRDVLRESYNIYEKNLPEGYLHFGNKNEVKKLCVFLQHNPLFASALKYNGINQSRHILVVDSEDITTWFGKLMAVLDNKVYSSFKPIRAEFTSSPSNCIQSLELVSITINGVQPDDVHLAAAKLIILLRIYATYIHVAIHIYHYVLISGISIACSSNAIMEAWAEPYRLNIKSTYLASRELLLSSKHGLLVGEGSHSIEVALTDRSKFLDVIKAMIVEWGSFTTSNQFVQSFLLKDIGGGNLNLIKELQIVPQFLLHQSLCSGFASEISSFLANEVPSDAELRLKDFFYGISDDKYPGEKGKFISISSINEWIEAITVTGILHGSTMAIGRLTLTQPYLSIAIPTNKSKYYSDKEFRAMITAYRTINGLSSDRYAFSKHLYGKDDIHVPEKVLSIHGKYDALTTSYKYDFLAELRKPDNLELFRDYGWILTDFAPENIDGNQLTVTSYV